MSRPNPNPQESAPSESAPQIAPPGTLAHLQRLAAVATRELANLRNELAAERARVGEYSAKLIELRRSTRTMGETAHAKALAATDAIAAAVDARDVAEVLGKFQVDPKRGLEDSDLFQARSVYGRNEIPPEKGTPFWKLVLKQFDDLLVKILLASAAISVVFSSA